MKSNDDEDLLFTIILHVSNLRTNLIQFNDNIKDAKMERRMLERRWRLSSLTVDRQILVDQFRLVNDLIYLAKMAYYADLIKELESDKKSLFATIGKFLQLKAEEKLPSCDISMHSLTNLRRRYQISGLG